MWYKGYQQFLEFKADHDTPIVPTKSKKYKYLGGWVGENLSHYRKRMAGKPNNMTDERLKLLNDAEFVWNVFDVKWLSSFDDLKEFKEKHGHLRVPRKSYPPCQSLVNWVARQRAEYSVWIKEREADERRKQTDGDDDDDHDDGGGGRRRCGVKKCFLTQTRVSKLEELGFDWYGSHADSEEEPPPTASADALASDETADAGERKPSSPAAPAPAAVADEFDDDIPF